MRVLCRSFFAYHIQVACSRGYILVGYVLTVLAVQSWIKLLHQSQVLFGIIVSRVFNRRKRFRAFPQPASVPGKRSFPDSFRVFPRPSIYPFVKAKPVIHTWNRGISGFNLSWKYKTQLPQYIRVNACINTQKFKGLDSRQDTSLSEIKKSDLHGKSFQSSPKINRMLITGLTVYNTRPSRFC